MFTIIIYQFYSQYFAPSLPLLSIITYFWVFITHLSTCSEIFFMQGPSCSSLYAGHTCVHFRVHLLPHIMVPFISFDKNTTWKDRGLGIRKVSNEYEGMSKNKKTENRG